MLLQLNLYSKSDTSKVAVTVLKFGDYYISNHAFVHGNILSVKHSGSYSETDSLVTLFDRKGKVLFMDRIANEPTNDVSVSVDTMSFCGVGTLIAYNSNDNSGYGNCTNSIQLWGYNQSGEFVPFTGFIPVCEVMICNNAISTLIRENKTHEIPAVIETSAKEGMISLNRAIVDLVRRKEISLKSATDYSLDPGEVRNLLR